MPVHPSDMSSTLGLHREEQGFTLVEILTVMLIVGIMVGIAVPVYQGHQRRGYRTAAHADLRAATLSLESWVVGEPPAVGYSNLRSSPYYRDTFGPRWAGSPGVTVDVSGRGLSATTYCVEVVHSALPGQVWRVLKGTDNGPQALRC